MSSESKNVLGEHGEWGVVHCSGWWVNGVAQWEVGLHPAGPFGQAEEFRLFLMGCREPLEVFASE